MKVVSLRLSEDDKAFAKYFARTDDLSKAIRMLIDHVREKKEPTEVRSSIVRPRRVGMMPSNLFNEEPPKQDGPAFSSRS